MTDPKLELEKQPSSRPGMQRFEGVLDPTDPTGTRRTFAWLLISDAQETYRTNRWRFFNLRAAWETLKSPTVVFRGIRRNQDDEEEWGWCFSAHDVSLWRDAISSYPMAESEVFVVFLDSRFTLYDWRTETRDSAEPTWPVQKGPRFAEVAWQRT